MSDPETLWLVGRTIDAISFLMIFNPGPISAPAAAGGTGASAVVGAVAATTTPLTISAAADRDYVLYI